MPPSQTSPAPAAHAVSYGQVIEYIQDRIYLASYTHAPNEATPFPYPCTASRSPQKRSSKSQRGPTPAPVSTGPKVHPPVYFTIDDSLLYNAFHADFGPLHIGHLYRFAVTLHDYLGDPANEGRGVVFWSRADSRSRANAACLLACYMVLIQGWAPHLALAPIAQADPPLMPFRDAGYSQADYVLNVQDVVYGVWKAKEEGLCGLRDFSLEEYERFERVDMGDFNWLTPQFLAFASPQHKPTAPIPTSSPLYATLPTTLAAVKASSLPQPFKNVLCHFSSRNIGLVVRLNSELYSPSYFTALGINHLDMIFDDGTCPPLALVKKFIKLAHETITLKHKAIAVHCKAGLGRTGCLIGAYLIYRHGFTANEIIAFMRFMRPGMVVGPQQHWLHINQGTFREWWWEAILQEKLARLLPSTPSKPSSSASQRHKPTQTATPPNPPSSQPPPPPRHALAELSHNETTAPGPEPDDTHLLPAPTPGQPRKSTRSPSRHHPYSRHPSSSSAAALGVENATGSADDIVGIDGGEEEEEGVLARERRRGQDESEDEWVLRLLTGRAGSCSPGSGGGRGGDVGRRARAVSFEMSSMTRVRFTGEGVKMEGEEIWEEEVGGEGGRRGEKGYAGLGVGVGVRGGEGGVKALGLGRGGWRRSTERGVRKTSGRVGSLGRGGSG